MSGLKYFGRGTMFTNDVDGGCECNPDDCYNPDFPMVSRYQRLKVVFLAKLCYVRLRVQNSLTESVGCMIVAHK